MKIIDIDLERRRISLSIKQAAEGGEVAAEYREFYGEHAYDEQGNYIGPDYQADTEGAEGGEGGEGAEATACDRGHRRCDRGRRCGRDRARRHRRAGPRRGRRSGRQHRSPRRRKPPKPRPPDAPHVRRVTGGARSTRAGPFRVWRSACRPGAATRSPNVCRRRSSVMATPLAHRCGRLRRRRRKAERRGDLSAMSQSVKADVKLKSAKACELESRSRAVRRDPRPIASGTTEIPLPRAPANRRDSRGRSAAAVP